MIGKRFGSKVLSVQMIANVAENLAEALELNSNQNAIGIVTSDSDDVMYVALDEATKVASVDVVYANSFYAGADNANTPYAGEVIGVIAGSSPSEVRSGLTRILEVVENEASFYAADKEETVPYFAHTVSRTGSHLSKEAGIELGEPLAYLIAPPTEAMIGLDKALKAADVRMVNFYGPPTETNYAGGLLTGTQSACKAASDAFEQAVKDVAQNPVHIGRG